MPRGCLSTKGAQLFDKLLDLGGRTVVLHPDDDLDLAATASAAVVDELVDEARVRNDDDRILVGADVRRPDPDALDLAQVPHHLDEVPPA